MNEILDPLKATVTYLQNKLTTSNTHFNELKKKHDDLAQYTRRQNIRISGFVEQDGENIDDLLVSFARDALNLQIDALEIDKSHRIGRKMPSKPSRHIVVHFIPYRTNTMFMKALKAAKIYNRGHHTSHSISEDLTRNRCNICLHTG